MISVLVVDDHAVVRQGLRTFLELQDDIEGVGEAADGEAALAAVAELAPDVVLMDLVMPVLDGVGATRELVACCPEARVVVLTSFSDRERILAALDAGAIGYLLKDAEPDEVLRGIRAVARGESPIDPKAARELLGSRRTTAAAELTPRENEVLALVRQGLANKQIARRLGISERTVKAHLTSAFQRIGVVDRTQAALWAERNGIG